MSDNQTLTLPDLSQHVPDLTPFRYNIGDDNEYIEKANNAQAYLETFFTDYNASLTQYGQVILAYLEAAQDVPISIRNQFTQLVQDAQAAAAQAAAVLSGINLPTVTVDGKGKVLVVNPHGTGYELVDLPDSGESTVAQERFPAATAGANWEDTARAFYQVSKRLGQQVEMLSLPYSDGLGYSGTAVTLNGDSYQYIKLFDAAVASALEDGKTFLETAQSAIAVEIALMMGSINVEHSSQHGSLYGNNYRAAGVLYTVNGSQSTMQNMSSGILLGGSGYSYLKADLLLTPDVQIFIEFDALGAHLFVKRADEDYTGTISVFEAALALPSSTSSGTSSGGGSLVEDSEGFLMYTPAGETVPVYRPGQLLQRKAILWDYDIPASSMYERESAGRAFTPKGFRKIVLSFSAEAVLRSIPNTNAVYTITVDIMAGPVITLLSWSLLMRKEVNGLHGLERYITKYQEVYTWVGQQPITVKVSCASTSTAQVLANMYELRDCQLMLEEFS